jgi:hydroxymethylglutaryl-CoA lyase
MRTFDIHVVEVGPRDGLQMAKGVLPTHLKKRWISEGVAAGLTEIEVCSFVPPSVVPGMADAAEVTRYARTFQGLEVSVLVPNARGAENAIAAGAHKMIMPISVSRSHNTANIRKTHDQSIEELKKVRALVDAQPAGQRPTIEIGLSTSFGCSIEGDVPEKDVVALSERVIGVGAGNPAQVKRLFPAVRRAVGAAKLGGAHFHNTRGQGLANVVAALDVGVTSFDSSLAGLGGCPFAPGASGNICTEDLVWMLHEMGFTTGIDLAKLIAIREVLKEGIPGDTLYGHVAGVGLGKRSAAEARVAAAR